MSVKESISRNLRKQRADSREQIKILDSLRFIRFRDAAIARARQYDSCQLEITARDEMTGQRYTVAEHGAVSRVLGCVALTPLRLFMEMCEPVIALLRQVLQH